MLLDGCSTDFGAFQTRHLNRTSVCIRHFWNKGTRESVIDQSVHFHPGKDGGSQIVHASMPLESLLPDRQQQDTSQISNMFTST